MATFFAWRESAAPSGIVSPFVALALVAQADAMLNMQIFVVTIIISPALHDPIVRSPMVRLFCAGSDCARRTNSQALRVLFEVLHFAFVLPGLFKTCEGAEVAASPSLSILLSRVEPKLSGLKFSNHVDLM